MRRLIAVGFLVCCPLFSPIACVRQSGIGSSATGLDPKLSLSTYIEEGDLVALVVSARAAHFRLTRSHIPLEVAVVNKGLEKLSLTRESFILVTADGRRYPAVGREELVRSYGRTDVDRRFSEAAPLVHNKFSSFEQVSSNFTPGFDAPIARDHVFLPRFGYMIDFLYFPRPEGDLVGQRLELVVRAPELPDPVFVRFAIEGKRKQR